jgi:hypothetical protein
MSYLYAIELIMGAARRLFADLNAIFEMPHHEPHFPDLLRQSTEARVNIFVCVPDREKRHFDLAR